MCARWDTIVNVWYAMDKRMGFLCLRCLITPCVEAPRVTRKDKSDFVALLWQQCRFCHLACSRLRTCKSWRQCICNVCTLARIQFAQRTWISSWLQLHWVTSAISLVVIAILAIIKGKHRHVVKYSQIVFIINPNCSILCNKLGYSSHQVGMITTYVRVMLWITLMKRPSIWAH